MEMADGRSVKDMRVYLMAKHQAKLSTRKIELCIQSYLKRQNNEQRANSFSSSGIADFSTGEGRVQESGGGKEHQIRNAETRKDRKRKERDASDQAETRRKNQKAEAEKERLRQKAEDEKRREKEASDRAKDERRRKEAVEKEQQRKWEMEREELKRKKQKEVLDRAVAERTKEEMKAEEERRRQIAEAEADKKRKEKEQAEMERMMQAMNAADERMRRPPESKAEKTRKEIDASEKDKAERRKKKIEAQVERRRRLAESDADQRRKGKEGRVERKKQKIEAMEERRRRDTQAEAERMRRLQEETESAAKREKEIQNSTGKIYVENIPHSRTGPEKRKNQEEAVNGEDRLIMVNQHKRRKEHQSVDERVRTRIETETGKINQEKESSTNKERKKRVAELEETENAATINPSKSTTTFTELPEINPVSAADSRRSPSVCALESSSAPLPNKKKPLSREEVQKDELKGLLAAFRDWKDHDPRFRKSGKKLSKSANTKQTSSSKTGPDVSLSSRKMITSTDLTGSECVRDQGTSQETVDNRMEDAEDIQSEELHNCPKKKEKSKNDLNRVSITVISDTPALSLSESTANDPLKSSSAGSMETEIRYKSNFEMKKYRLRKIKTEEPNTDELECDYSQENECLANVYPKEKIAEMRRWFFRERHPADKTALSQSSQAKKTETIEPSHSITEYGKPHMSVTEYNLTFLFGNGYVQFEFVTEEEQLELEKPDVVVTQTDVDEDDEEEIQVTESTINKKPFICRCPHNQEVLTKKEIYRAAMKDARRIIRKHEAFSRTYVECISREAISRYKTRSGNLPWVEDKRYALKTDVNPSHETYEQDMKCDRDQLPIDPKFHRPGIIVGGIPRCYRLRDVPKICATCNGRIRVYYKPTGFKPIEFIMKQEFNDPNRKPTKRELRYWRFLRNIDIRKRKRVREGHRKARLAKKKSRAEIFFTKDYYNEFVDSQLTFMDYHQKCLRRFPELVPRSVKEFFKAFPTKFVLEKFHPKTDENNERFLTELLGILNEIDDPEKSGCDKAWDSVSELETDSGSEIGEEEEDSRSPSSCLGAESEEEQSGDPKSLTVSKEVHFASVTASFTVAPVAQKANTPNEEEKDSDKPNEDPVETVAKSAANQPSEHIFGEDELLNNQIDNDFGVVNNEENNGILDEPIDNAHEEPTPPVIENAEVVGNNGEDDQPRRLTPVQSQEQNVNASAKSPTPDLLRISPSNQELHNEISERFEEGELLRSVNPSDPVSTSTPICNNFDINMDLEQTGDVDTGVTLETLSPQTENLLNSSDSNQVEREQLQYTEEDLLGEYGQLEEVQEPPGDNTEEPVEPVAKKSKQEENSATHKKKPIHKRRGRLNKVRNDDIEVEDTTGTANEPTGTVVEEEDSSRKQVVFTENKKDVLRKRATSTTTNFEKSGIQSAPEQTDETIGNVVGEAGTSNPSAASEVQKAKNTRKPRAARNAKLEAGTSSNICEPVEEETEEREAGNNHSVALAETSGKQTELAETASEPVEATPLETEMEEGSEQADHPVEDGMEDAVGEVEDDYEMPVTRKRGRNEDAPFLPTNATRTKRHFLSKNNPAPRTRKGRNNEPVASDEPVRLTGVVNKDDVAESGNGNSDNFKKLPQAVQKLLNFDSPEKQVQSGSSEEVEVKTEPADDEEWAIPDPIGANTRASRKRVRQEKERSILAKIKKEVVPDEECQVLMMNVNQVKEEVDDPDFQVLSIGFNKEAVEPEEEAPPFKEIDANWEEQADHRCLMMKGIWNDANEVFCSDPAKFSKLMLIIANDSQTAGRVFKYSATVEDRYSKFDPEFIKLLAASSRVLTDEQQSCLNYNNFSKIYHSMASQSVINHKITPVNLHNVLATIMEIKRCFREDARSFMNLNENNDAVNATEAILLGQFVACSLKMAGLSLVTWATSTHVHRRLEMIYYGWRMFLYSGGFLRILLALDRPDVKPISDSFRAYCTEYLEEIERNYKKAIEIVKMSDDAIMEHFRDQANLSEEEMANINADITNESTDSNKMQCLQCSYNQIEAWFSTFDLKLSHSRLHDINTHTCEKCYEDMTDFRYALHRISMHSSLKTGLIN